MRPPSDQHRLASRSLALPVLACVFAVICTSARAADDPRLAAQTLAVFQQKCAACHGPQAKKPKKFAYVTDLPRLAANPKLITPRDPAKSKIWQSIEDGDMPPDDAETGPLSDAQKQLIKRWIETGAPPLAVEAQLAGAKLSPTTAPAAVPTQGPTMSAVDPSPADLEPQNNTPAQPLSRRLIRWIGKLHPLVVHFPIALLTAAALAEGVWLFKRTHWLTAAVRFCTVTGAIGAVAAGALGWLNASFHTRSELLVLHTWLGTAAVLWVLPLAFVCERHTRHAATPAAPQPTTDWTGRSRIAFQLALFAGVVLISVAAHLGGALVYGENYLKF